MIAGLRRRHRGMVTVVFVIVICLYAWAIFARKAGRRVPSPPGAEHRSRGTETVVP